MPAQILIFPGANTAAELLNCKSLEPSVLFSIAKKSAPTPPFFRARAIPLPNGSFPEVIRSKSQRMSLDSEGCDFLDDGMILWPDPAKEGDSSFGGGVGGGLLGGGGGILLPGMKEALESKLGTGIIVPKDPVFSNAIGLYKLAAKTC